MPRKIAAVLPLLLAACTMATPIAGPGGERLMLIECGASTPFSNCYKRANEECPQGYQEIDQQHGFNRASLRIKCS